MDTVNGVPDVVDGEEGWCCLWERCWGRGVGAESPFAVEEEEGAEAEDEAEEEGG